MDTVRAIGMGTIAVTIRTVGKSGMSGASVGITAATTTRL
jgi:hypothetical protein